MAVLDNPNIEKPKEPQVVPQAVPQATNPGPTQQALATAPRLEKITPDAIGKFLFFLFSIKYNLVYNQGNSFLVFVSKLSWFFELWILK